MCVLAVDHIPARLDLARTNGDEVINFDQERPMMSAIDAYKAFDQRKPGWIKVELLPAAGPVAA